MEAHTLSPVAFPPEWVQARALAGAIGSQPFLQYRRGDHAVDQRYASGGICKRVTAAASPCRLLKAAIAVAHARASLRRHGIM